MLQERRDSQAGHWHGELVDEFETSLDALNDLLPSFHRIPFGPHPRKDIILRAVESRSPPMPVGIVSKRYALLQHTDVLRGLTDALVTNDIDAAPLEAHLALTEYGTRMSLRVMLPDALALEAFDGHRMALTFECFNSVDGSVPLFALVGWFRFVCRNGFVIGTTCARVRRRHRGSHRMTIEAARGAAQMGIRGRN